MNEPQQVTGFFTDEAGCARGIAALRNAGFGKPHVFAPFASEAILAVLGGARSPVRLWVLLGGLVGCASGFALAIGLSAEYPHVTAGMPIVSLPPFVIIAFELTILCGALSGVVGFLVHARVPRLELIPGYNAVFSNDRFGVVIDCAPGDSERADALLAWAGAVEVTTSVSSHTHGDAASEEK